MGEVSDAELRRELMGGVEEVEVKVIDQVKNKNVFE